MNYADRALELLKLGVLALILAFLFAVAIALLPVLLPLVGLGWLVDRVLRVLAKRERNAP